MRSAPSVTSPVGRSSFGAGLSVGAWCLGAVGLLAWSLGPAPLGWRQAVVAATLLVSAWPWLAGRRRPVGGTLAWDGSAWRRQGADGVYVVQVEVTCDLQRWVLVRLERDPSAGRTGPRVEWLWLESGGDRQRWLAVRRALYFRGTSEALPDGPAAKP